ncbi:glucose-1-phosphate thymidylyltransferase [Halobacterium litoreum]|uniref:Glucose-1-phosphate thymidylyltransferase n=1 Tax=Halobacterium litoreum TaxID=2039234 RepID=A0ABD5NAK4_9EURY|nr:glucose-1-phosphate thymidylyltransferase [Halobacterium litoreum]UHH14723.1 glucose-1-phosphate thymidylyltransferase [Halobacterium litoreum]
MKGVILSGGRGTRLRPITHTGPKQLVPVANKPVIQYAVEDLAEAGIEEIGIVLGKKGAEEIQDFLGDGSEFGVEITYIFQGEPLGLSHAAGCAQAFVGDDDFIMYLGDNMLKQGISELVESFESGDFDAGIALQSVDNPEQFGVAAVDEEGTVTRLVEKPENPPSDLALIGVYVFSPAVFEVIEELEPSWRGELEITDAIQELLENGGRIDSHVVRGWWKDTGKPTDILEANRLVLDDKTGRIQGEIRDGAEISGDIELQQGAVVESGAVVRGPVSIGANVTVTSGTYVGPYTSIGANTTVDGAHIENSVIIGDSTLSTSEKIVDSLLGSGTEIESSDGLLPDGHRLVVGENSSLNL